LRPLIEQSLSGGGRVELLVGLDFFNTEAKALRAIYEMSQVGLPVQCYCLTSLPTATAAIYHPKLYIIASKNETTIAIGSSNLTMGGLRTNVEANAILNAAPEDELVSDAYALYNRLKFDDRRVPLDAKLIDLYQAIHDHTGKQAQMASRDAKTRELTRAFKEKVASLKRPQPTENDLYGWQKIVYERLPDGPFSNSAVYAYEREFEHYYPENQNIRPKIRQILQQLERLRLVKHLRPNLWQRNP